MLTWGFSLQALNSYCDDLASGRIVRDAHLTFYVRSATSNDPLVAAREAQGLQTEGIGVGNLERIDAVLPARGSLAPLLHAFGLLSGDALHQLADEDIPGAIHHTLALII